MNSDNLEELKDSYKHVLQLLGEDTAREGLQKTPLRVAKAMTALTCGYQQDAVQILNSAKFSEDYNEVVLVRDIEFYSLCEHHMLPFFGKAHVAYIPNGAITGLSKLARVVDVFARRFQVQERMTQQIAQAIDEALAPKGVFVMVEAQHMCMQMRGVEKQGATTATTFSTGCFSDEARRREIIELIKR